MTRYDLKTFAVALTAVALGIALRADARAPEADSASQWAGSYWHSQPNSTMTMQLVITPESRFILSMGGCFGSSVVTRGKISHRDGVLTLDPKLPAEPGSAFDFRTMFLTREGAKLYFASNQQSGFFVRDSYLE